MDSGGSNAVSHAFIRQKLAFAAQEFSSKKISNNFNEKLSFLKRLMLLSLLFRN